MAVSLVPRDPRRDVVALDRVPGFAAAVERGPGAGRAAGDHAAELVGAHRPVSQRYAGRLSGSVRCCRRRGPVRRGSSEDARPCIDGKPRLGVRQHRQHAHLHRPDPSHRLGPARARRRAAPHRLRPAERRRAGHRRACAGGVAASRRGRQRRRARVRVPTRSASAPPTSSRPAVIVVERLQRRPGRRRCSIRASAPIAPGRSARASTNGRQRRQPRGTGSSPASISPAASATVQSTFAGRVGELINGLPARVWDFTDPSGASDWRRATLSLFAGRHNRHRACASRSTAACASSASRGSAAPGTDATIGWQSLLPRAGVHWTDASISGSSRPSANTAATVTVCRLAISRYGDPTAPTGADVPVECAGRRGHAAARRGRPAGAASRSRHAAASPDSRDRSGVAGARAWTKRFSASRRGRIRRTFVRLAAIGRREAQPDRRRQHRRAGVDLFDDRRARHGHRHVGAEDDQILLFYNRSPATFGADRYLLTNPADRRGVVRRRRHDRHRSSAALFLHRWASRRADRKGCRPTADSGRSRTTPAVLGEVYINPNARDHAQGRVFTERGYTIKLAVDATSSRTRSTFGLIARYQDGQHFARLVIMDGAQSGRRSGARVPQRPDPLHVFDDGRRAAAESASRSAAVS